jgi:DNA-binding CsgD family transcriptional regulator
VDRQKLATAEATTASRPPTSPALSVRQLEVLNLIVLGRSNKEIARILKLGPGTVKVHVSALFGKLGVNRRAAVAIAGARLISDSRLGVTRSSSAQIIPFPGLGYTSRLWPRTRAGFERRRPA